jgi:hypothetical protein
MKTQDETNRYNNFLNQLIFSKIFFPEWLDLASFINLFHKTYVYEKKNQK